VLVVHYVTESEPARAAFYFAKPPPVEPPGVKKRKARRQAVHYLGMSNVDIKEEVKAWERAIRDAMKTARETGSASGG